MTQILACHPQQQLHKKSPFFDENELFQIGIFIYSLFIWKENVFKMDKLQITNYGHKKGDAHDNPVFVQLSPEQLLAGSEGLVKLHTLARKPPPAALHDQMNLFVPPTIVFISSLESFFDFIMNNRFG